MAKKEKEEKKEKKSNQLSLFDYINMMFADPDKFSKLSSYEKSKNFFMMNRFFAIKHPIQANIFNHIKIESGEAVQYWCDSLSKVYKRTPEWIFNTLREVKTEKKKEKEKFDFKEETIDKYCAVHKCSRRDFFEALDFFEDEFIEDLKKFEKLVY